MRGSLYSESDELKNLGLRLTSGTYCEPLPFLHLALKSTDFTIYLAPEDLPRIASMLRQSAESIEALIGTPNETVAKIVPLRIAA